MHMDVECNRCLISSYCPEKGTTPIRFNQHLIPCQLVGGYGKEPVERNRVSSKNLPLYDAHGPSVSIALVPYVDECKNLATKTVKVFHPPVKHARETTDVNFRDTLMTHGKSS